MKKLLGDTEVENALKKLDNLTTEAAHMTEVQTLHVVDEVKSMLEGAYYVSLLWHSDSSV
jgi:hypothetical protein